MVKVLVETPLESCGISLTPTKRSSDVWLVKTYATGDLGLGERRLRRLGGGGHLLTALLMVSSISLGFTVLGELTI